MLKMLKAVKLFLSTQLVTYLVLFFLITFFGTIPTLSAYQRVDNSPAAHQYHPLVQLKGAELEARTCYIECYMSE